MYVAIEGVDTSGKSTQIALLQVRFPEAIMTHEPGGTPLGAKLREILLHHPVQSARAELFLFLADRAEHYAQVIAPHEGGLIISDRSLYSGMAYAHEADVEFLYELNLYALEGKRPDRVVLLWLTEEELVRRRSAKRLDRIESQGVARHLEIQERLKGLLERFGVCHKVIDATCAAEEIHEEIVAFLAL